MAKDTSKVLQTAQDLKKLAMPIILDKERDIINNIQDTMCSLAENGRISLTIPSPGSTVTGYLKALGYKIEGPTSKGEVITISWM